MIIDPECGYFNEEKYDEFSPYPGECEDCYRVEICLEAKKKESNKCKYCEGGKPLVTGKSNDQGIAIQYPNRLIAYGYDIHGYGSNGLVTRINYCPMCGKKLKEDDTR